MDQHGALSAAEIAEHVKATGRDINNRTVSFALQALKKRGLAKKHGRQMVAAEGARTSPCCVNRSEQSTGRSCRVKKGGFWRL
ncbi:winged-helix domain-containing protein [Methylocella tundrae]|uniref:winged-helix domain-containing protein n=1 Tax=Methylocella tundrae TaxID=227605 RepID=UPI003CC7C996